MIRFKLGEILASKRITATEIHEKTGIAKSTISAIVNNNSEMVRLSTVDEICKFLEITPSDFFEYLPLSLGIKFERIEHEKIEDSTIYWGQLLLNVSRKMDDFLFYYYLGLDTESKNILVCYVDLSIHEKERLKSTIGGFTEDIKNYIANEIMKLALVKLELSFNQTMIEIDLQPVANEQYTKKLVENSLLNDNYISIRGEPCKKIDVEQFLNNVSEEESEDAVALQEDIKKILNK